jgi:excisionase family DNA binding protein
MTEPIAQGWITTDEAGELTGYSKAYLRGLASGGRVEARKIGRDWLVERESLLAYKAQMDALGGQRHNPWRRGLAEQGRGRQRGSKDG